MSNPKSKYHLNKIDFTTHFSNTPRYLIAGGVLIHSFIKNHQDIKHIKIHILEDNVTPANKKKIQSIVDTDAKNYNLNLELAWIDISEEIKWCQSHNIPPYHGSYAGTCSILAISQIQPISEILVQADATCLFDANLTKLWSKFYQSGKAIWDDDALHGFSTIFWALKVNAISNLLESYRKNFLELKQISPSASNCESAANIWTKSFFNKYYFGSPRLTSTPFTYGSKYSNFYKWIGKEVFPCEINADPNDKLVLKWRSYAKETIFANTIIPESVQYQMKYYRSPFLIRMIDNIRVYSKNRFFFLMYFFLYYFLHYIDYKFPRGHLVDSSGNKLVS